MKKHFYFIFTLILSGLYSASFAQETQHVLGLKIGPSYNTVYGYKDLYENSQPIFLTSTEFKPAYLYSIGLSYQFNINRNFSLQTGLGHDFKGEVTYVNYLDYNDQVLTKVTHIRRISYLVAPVIVRAYFGEKLKFFFNAGAYAGLALSHTIRTKIDDHKMSRHLAMENTRPIDLGLIAGAGLELPINSKFDVSLELRNNLGLTDLRKKEYTTKDHLRLNSISLLAGLSYNFGGKN